METQRDDDAAAADFTRPAAAQLGVPSCIWLDVFGAEGVDRMSDLAVLLRPRSGPEIIDAAFQVMREQYPAFIVLSLLPYVVIVPVETLVPSLYGEDTRVLPTILYILLSTAVDAIPEAATAVLASSVLLRQTMSPAAALRRAATHGATVVGASVLVTVAFFVGLMLFIIPGISVAISYFAIPAVIVLERLDLRSALRRSRDLARGARGRVFLFFVFPSLALFAAFGIVEVWLGGWLDDPAALRAVSILVSALVSPVLSAIAVVLYYDLRIRKEAFDLEVLSGRLTTAPTGDSSGATGS